MAHRALCLVVLTTLLCLTRSQNRTCLKSASTCGECIQSGPDCGWCLDPHAPSRCDSAETLQSEACTHVYNPRGDVMILRNVPADGRSVLLEPQELSITLRPGVSQVVHLRLTTSQDQPVSELIRPAPLPEPLSIYYNTISTNPGVFEVTLKADKCPSNEDSNQSQNRTGPWSVLIKPKDFPQIVKMKVSLECSCECLSTPETHSPECSGRGSRVCGLCVCPEPYSGDSCQTNNDYCRPNPLAPVCSGRGTCENNFCVCTEHQDVSEKYYGRFCECSNFDCPRDKGSLCGGRGKCECGYCVCDEGWTGDTCSCTMDPTPCMGDNQMICSGHGVCDCGVCRCEPPYSGPTCEFCPTCENRCQRHMSCAECRVFETARCDSKCSGLTVNLVDGIEDIPAPLCRMISRRDSCFIHFSYSGSSSNGRLTVAKTKQCPRPVYQ